MTSPYSSWGKSLLQAHAIGFRSKVAKDPSSPKIAALARCRLCLVDRLVGSRRHFASQRPEITIRKKDGYKLVSHEDVRDHDNR